MSTSTRGADRRRGVTPTSVRATALLALGLLWAGAALAQTTGPTSDPLRGERRLLPLDDVIVVSWLGNSGGDFASPYVNFLESEQNQLLDDLQAFPAAGSRVTFAASAGKMFAAPRDTIAVALDQQLHLFLGETDPAWSGTMPNMANDAHTQLATLIRPLMAMVDFTGDGYAEIVIGTANGGLQVATAVDRTDPSQGVRWGDLYTDVNTIAGSALATGDFNGDGLPELALAYPAEGNDTGPATEFRVEIYKVDPTQLFLNFAASVTVSTASYGQQFPIRKVSIAAGDFDKDVSDLGLPDEELVVTVSGEDDDDNHFAIQMFEVFPSTLQPLPQSSQHHTTSEFGECSSDCPFVSTVVESARLDWTGTLDQAVVGITAAADAAQRHAPVSEFWILQFTGDDDLQFDLVTQQDPGFHSVDNCVSEVRGLAIGNFDRDSLIPAPAIPTSLSIAVLQGFGPLVGGGVVCEDHSGHHPWVDIWTVDPSNSFSASNSSSTQMSMSSSESTAITNQLRTLLAGDFQGGSLWVGPPEIVSLEGLIEPEMVLQAPPMHIDFVPPVDASGADELNVSFGLPGFNTKFTESEGTTTTTSHQSTTSNSFAEKESLERSESFGVPDVASVSADLTVSSEQTQKEVVSQSSTTITSAISRFSSATDLDDLVWYSQQDLDIYIYPVLCPPDPTKPETCGTSPSHLMFSIPQSQKLYTAAPGATVEWYQPPHQVAEALSYPWTKSQLESLFPSATLDTKLEVDDLSAAGPLSAKFQWSEVGETTKSIGKTNTYSFDTSISISTDANVDIDVFNVGAKTKASFSFNTSRSMSTLNTSQSKVEGSIGFATSVPNASDLRSGNNPDYHYDFSVMVFGQAHPPCDGSDGASSAVTCLWDVRTLEEEIKTQGTLWAGYTIDLSSGGNNWWTAPATGYITSPDVALNHPEQWVLDQSQSTGDNCLTDSSTSARLCYVRSATSLQPAEMASNEFQRMKGFFVIPAIADTNGEFLEPQGPQTTIIDSDGQVWLQARVYNYSFLATGTDRLHVRFYAQEWDKNSFEPVNTPSVLVDEVVVDQCIPGHGAQGNAACSQGGDDNWLLVTTSQPFDPTAHGVDPGDSGTYVLFWVLVWLEDSAGNLVTELADHGLTGLPGNLTSLTDAARLSQSYSNNLGWFPLPIFVCPSGVDCANVTTSGAAEPDEAAAPQVRIARLEAPRRPIAVNAPTEVRAQLAAGEVSPRGVHVALYEGDPEADGGIFDVELVPYLRGNDSYLIRTVYRPTRCGPRDLVVVADPGGGAASATAAVPVNVSANPRVEIRALSGLLASAAAPRSERVALAGALRHAARAFRRDGAVAGLDALEDLRAKARRAGAMPPSIVDQIEARIDAFAACVAAAGGELGRAPRFRYRRR